MPALLEITQIVNAFVPTFFGTDGPDLKSEVCRFIQGCKMVEKELLEEPNAELTQTIIKCLKLRLLGSAYLRIAGLEFGSVDALCNQIKKFYLKKRNIDQIREQILSCKQNTRETASSFGDRIEVLLHEALDTITIQWEDESSQKVMTDDFKRVAVKTFIKGLRDRALRARFIDQQKRRVKFLNCDSRTGRRNF
ncbi:hypothetical protein EVAR_91058_1 [Eumeta japonica]|uniref:Uncharacterized protein n=1 Tax=Eumeta variegata TaxID=151549 RepID=A0A4C1S9A8_EUMVA|nr:hypothetical protein EVAR_91058_1 [Eumeta japonica]